MRFSSNGKNVEVKAGKVTVDGAEMSHEDAEKATGTRFIRGGSEPINLGNGKQHNEPDNRRDRR